MVLEDVGGLPAFRKIDCPLKESEFDVCVAVHFDDAENTQDLIMVNAELETPTVLKGTLKSNGRKAVIILRDDYNEEETVGIKIIVVLKTYNY